MRLLRISHAETEEQELGRVQHNNSSAPPVQPTEAAAAPPAAPLPQYISPADAVASGAEAASRRAAAAAGAPTSVASLAEAEQRHALAAAAAVAMESTAEVLSTEGDEEGSMLDAAEIAVGGEEEQALAADIRAEVLPPGNQALVVTRAGETALPATSPARGAGEAAVQHCCGMPLCQLSAHLCNLLLSPVPARGPSPLPPDPFEMTGEQESLGIGTLKELKVGCPATMH